jgi:hypothetical protein
MALTTASQFSYAIFDRNFDERPSFEPVEEDEETSKTQDEGKTPDTPPRERKTPAASTRAGARSASRFRLASPEREGEANLREQKDIISAWIDDPEHPATETCR